MIVELLAYYQLLLIKHIIINSMCNNKYITVDNLVFINTRLKDSEGYVDTTPTTVICILKKNKQ